MTTIPDAARVLVGARVSLHSRAVLAWFLALALARLAGADEIVIPEVHIPAQTIPGYTIPGYTIPAQRTPYGVIPEIVVPTIVVPDIHVPEVRTSRTVIELPDYHLISREDLVNYSRRTPQPVPRPAPLRITHESMSRSDRIQAFSAYDRRASSSLLELFADADTDRSGTLSWPELAAFQRRLMSSHRYRSNGYALHPVDFMKAGGGDCEDFSLVTVLLARFWGWDAYVACFFDRRSGHAIAMVRSPGPVPRNYQSFSLTGVRTLHGDSVPAGRYVPVDYEHVGSYSTALRAGMVMEYIMSPEQMYGEVM
jgi:hypothetical protein